MKSPKPGIRVAPSRIGTGVYATRGFAAEETVGEVRGRHLDDVGYGSDYCIDLGEGQALEPEPPFRFINHSCDPNCQLVVYDEDAIDPHRVWVETLRQVTAGEELTIDYAWPAETAIACRCGSPACRGWIVAEEELDELRSG